MSWIKRRGQTSTTNPSSAPPMPMYNPNQHSNVQSQWQQQDLQPPSNNWYPPNQINQQKLVSTSNQSQPQQESNYWNQSYNQTITPPNPINNYSSQFSQYNPALYSNENTNYQQNNINQQPQNSDSWNWGWGDEDNSNIQHLQQSNLNVNTNNSASSANFVTSEETWNWSVDEKTTNASNCNSENLSESQLFNSNVNLHNTYQNSQHVSNTQTNTFSQMGQLTEEYRSTEKSSLDHIQEQNFNKPPPTSTESSLSKHSKPDHLTPQWSIESQMSQDSSDLFHTSESDKSHMLSRSSTVSESPVSGHDVPSETMQKHDISHVELQKQQTLPEASSTDNINYFEQTLYNVQQEENKEDVSSITSDLQKFKCNSSPPPLPPKNQTPPLGPTSFDDNIRNPYKLNIGLPHKHINKLNLENKPVGNYSVSQMKYPISQSPFNQSVNLETLPDNSEQPDTFLHSFKKNPLKTPQQWPENNEAPINDRNQYLETGQLSNIDYSHSNITSDNSDMLPPPGFARMVLGQMEQTDNNSGVQDEPPPGLSRMVLGEPGSSSILKSEEPLHRMIPGGSSSPKSLSRYPSANYQLPKYGDNNESESELNTPISNQIRSATIGADTQSHATNVAVTSISGINRSKTIGADISLPYNSPNSESIKSNHTPGASNNFNNNIREANVDGANNLDKNLTQPVNTRRGSIEGEPQEHSVATLVSSIRDLTVGENLSSTGNTTLSGTDRSIRRPSKQESTDSECEPENIHLSRDRKDRRYYDNRDDYDRSKGRNRYSPSPDRYRDPKYERMRYRDKRYDDDIDYYSDKERDRRRDDRDRQEEFDRKYSSLKREKEKERRRKEHRSHRDYGRDSRREYYRYEDEYEDPSRSRPSSRSDSLHESYRQDRDRHRDRERHRRPRDNYNPYMQGYGYDPYNPHYYQQYQYHYFENLRRTNPQAYAEWYRKYYQQSSGQQGYGNEDRASVHSGRSSANEELSKDRAYDQIDSSSYIGDTTTASQRLTPAKFTTAHVKVSISSGRLVKLFPHYPLDGQPALVEVSTLHDLLINDEEYKNLIEFPGPLIKGVSHKKTIIEYCENKIRNALYNHDIGDVDSYTLMWELLILLLRQNGMVVGTDIAELLMKDKSQSSSRKGSIASNNSSAQVETLMFSETNASDTHGSSMSILKEEVVTNKFREYLLYGSEKEALEWAMKHGLWGHALFLASKLDKRTYANVMTRFANGLTINDPLQTLYQLLSGKVPAAVTSVADEKWGDWRPHLAMILSNTTQRPELDRKAITTLGDTLFNRGSLYAAQFCYLMAQMEFCRFGTESAKLVLLGSNHQKSFMEFAINDAIHMTEIYEYACSLNDSNFVIPEFLPYKYLLATRLADRGLLEKALAYLEKISLAIILNPTMVQPSLIRLISDLADRLKYYDIVEDTYECDGVLVNNRPDNSWLKELRAVETDYHAGVLSKDDLEVYEGSNVEVENQIAQTTYEQPVWSQQNVAYQPQWQPQYDQPNLDYKKTQGLESYTTEQSANVQQPYWSTQQTSEMIEQVGVNSSSQYQSNDQLQNDYWNKASTQDLHHPQISLPNQPTEHTTFEESHKEVTQMQTIKKDSPIKHKPQEKPTTGWFGGIWNKLSLRPKNQMKLPDDKNPTIIWDEQKKRWVNLESEGDGATAELKPPPKMSDLYPSTNQVANMNTAQDVSFHNPNNALIHTNEPPSNLSMVSNCIQPSLINPNVNNQPSSNFDQPTSNEEQIIQPKTMQSNLYKLQRSRNIKKSYVDVFNSGAKNSAGTSTLPAPDSFSTLPNNGMQMNYFVPAPVSDPNAPTDFLTPAPIQADENSQLKGVGKRK